MDTSIVRGYNLPEASPLLRSHSTPPSPSSSHSSLSSSAIEIDVPAITPTLTQLRSLDLDNLRVTDLVPPLDFPALEFAYVLVVLLFYRNERQRQGLVAGTSPDPHQWHLFEIAKADLAALDLKIQETWKIFLQDERGALDVEALLWTQFPLDRRKNSTWLNVISFLSDKNAPPYLVSHPIIEASIIRTWKKGKANRSGASRLWRFYDSCCTPRACQFLDLLSQLVFAVILANYLLYPPEIPYHITGANGMREILLLVLSSSWMLRPWRLSTVPLFLVFLAFASSFPYTLTVGDGLFTLLLWALVLQVAQLHYPSPPSPLFLFVPRQVLPLTVLLWRSISRAILPSIAFFLPAFVASIILLSLSLDGPLPSLREILPSVASSNPTPINVRFTFFILLAHVVCLMVALSLLLSVSLWHSPALSPWDRYSEGIGIASRIKFYHIVRIYTDLYYFPPPLNLYYTMLVVPISFPFFLCGRTLPHIQNATIWLWRLTVGPFMVAAAAASWILFPF